MLEWAIDHRGACWSLALDDFIGSFGILPFVENEFQPQVDEGFISLRLNTPVGTSLEYTDGKIREVEEALKAIPGNPRLS